MPPGSRTRSSLLSKTGDNLTTLEACHDPAFRTIHCCVYHDQCQPVLDVSTLISSILYVALVITVAKISIGRAAKVKVASPSPLNLQMSPNIDRITSVMGNCLRVQPARRLAAKTNAQLRTINLREARSEGEKFHSHNLTLTHPPSLKPRSAYTVSLATLLRLNSA